MGLDHCSIGTVLEYVNGCSLLDRETLSGRRGGWLRKSEEEIGDCTSLAPLEAPARRRRSM